VRYLIDTHALLWLVGSPSRLPAALLAELAAPSTALAASAATAMELATKIRLGKLPEAASLGREEGWREALGRIGASGEDLTPGQCLAAGSLAWAHRDPFDRLLAAQAIDLGLVLVTKDPAFATAPGLTTKWSPT
jgi:PIN domain nuclease of toxin-antitoxin system